MKTSYRRKWAIAGAVILGALTALWMISSSGLVILKIVEVSQELLERHQELLRLYGEVIR